LGSQLKSLEKLNIETDSLFKDTTKDKEAFKAELKTIRELSKEVPNWIADDYQKALKETNLSQNDNNISKMIFGKPVSIGLTFYLEHILRIRNFLNNNVLRNHKIDKSNLAKSHLPKIWIKKIIFSGTTIGNHTFAGEINDLTDNQYLIEKPIFLKFQGIMKNNTEIELEAVFDYRNNSKENVNLSLRNIPIRNIILTKSDYLPNKLISSIGSLSANLETIDNSFQANMVLKAKEIRLEPIKNFSNMNKDMIKSAKEIESLIHEIINKQELLINVEVDISEDSSIFNIESNLEKQIGEKIDKLLNQKKYSKKNELKVMVDKELQKYDQKIRKFADDKEKILISEIFKALNDANIEINSKSSVDEIIDDIVRKDLKKNEKILKDFEKKIKKKLGGI